MRAPAFSDTEIINAAITIAGKGARITPYTLIGQLGGGSLPYMQKALKRLVRDGKIQCDDIPDEDDEILQDIKSLLEKNRAEARLIANKEYQTDKNRLESSNAALREEITDLNRKFNALEIVAANRANYISKLEAKLEAANNLASTQQAEISRCNQQLAGTMEALTKAEHQAKDNLDRLHQAHIQFQGERRELLDRLSEITLSSRASIDSAQKSEQSMRAQLKQAMDDGLKHTSLIRKLRNEVKSFDEAKALVKKYGSWKTIAGLCINAKKNNDGS